MASLSTYNRNKGLTMIEIIVVIGILIVIFAFGLVVDFSSFTSNSLAGEESKVVSILQRARSRSMANLYDSSYGVCYLSSDYVIFRDGTCDKSATDETIPESSNITVAFIPNSPVIFSRLSGNTTGTPTIRLTYGSDYEDITINDEGTINW